MQEFIELNKKNINEIKGDLQRAGIFNTTSSTHDMLINKWVEIFLPELKNETEYKPFKGRAR